MKAKSSSNRSEPTRVALMNAALQVITETGVKSVTHRRVCAVAKVSLGTVNYHYADLNDLRLDAFSSYVDKVSARYEASFSVAHDDDDLADAVLRLIDGLSEDTESAILMWELYAEGGRDKSYRRLVRKWSKRAKSGVERFCSPFTATALEAMWDGAVMQRILGDSSLPPEELRKVILAIIRLDEDRHYPQLPADESGPKTVVGTARSSRRRTPAAVAAQ